MRQISLWSTNRVPVLWTNILASITGMHSQHNIWSCREIKITIRTSDIGHNHLMSQSIMTLWTLEIVITVGSIIMLPQSFKNKKNNKYLKMIMYHFDQLLVSMVLLPMCYNSLGIPMCGLIDSDHVKVINRYLLIVDCQTNQCNHHFYHYIALSQMVYVCTPCNSMLCCLLLFYLGVWRKYFGMWTA